MAATTNNLDLERIDVRAVQRPLCQRYAAEPAAARYTYCVGVDADAAELDDPWHVTATARAHGGKSYRMTINEKIGGSGFEPTPGDVLLAALAACQAMTFKSVAAAMGIRLTSLAVDVEGEVDHRGVLLMAGARAGFESITCLVRFAAAPGTDRRALAQLTAAAEKACAVTDTIRNATPLVVKMSPATST